MQIFYENGWNLPEEEEEPPSHGRPRAAFFFEELRTFANSWQDGTKKKSRSFTPALPPPVRQGIS